MLSSFGAKEVCALRSVGQGLGISGPLRKPIDKPTAIAHGDLVKKQVNNGRRKDTDAGIKGKASGTKKTAATKKRAKAAAKTSDGSAEATLARPSPKTSALLHAAGLGRLTRSASIAEPSSLVAARLHKAASGTSVTGKGKDGPGIPDDGPGEMTDLILPGSPRWKEILRSLLCDGNYRADPAVGKLPEDDLLRILGGMPFELRLAALEPYAAGARHFMKVPYHVLDTTPVSYRVHEEARRLVRPLACPEPPPERQLFGLAWYQGQFLQSVPPADLHATNVRADLRIQDVERMVGFDFDQELSDAAKCLEAAASHVHMALNGQLLCRRSPEYLRGLRDEISGIPNLPASETRNLAERAFALGVMYCRELIYPGIDHAWREWANKDREVWTEIVGHALARHGLETERKELLRLLGCSNYVDFKKDSKTEARFPTQHAPAAPSLTFSAFDGAYKDASRRLKSLRDTSGGAVSALNIKTRIGRDKKSEAQRKRLGDTKKNLRVLGKAMEELNKRDQQKHREEIQLGAAVARKADARAKDKNAQQVMKKL